MLRRGGGESLRDEPRSGKAGDSSSEMGGGAIFRQRAPGPLCDPSCSFCSRTLVWELGPDGMLDYRSGSIFSYVIIWEELLFTHSTSRPPHCLIGAGRTESPLPRLGPAGASSSRMLGIREGAGNGAAGANFFQPPLCCSVPASRGPCLSTAPTCRIGMPPPMPCIPTSRGDDLPALGPAGGPFLMPLGPVGGPCHCGFPLNRCPPPKPF